MSPCIAPKLKTLCLGKPIRFNADEEMDAQRSRICHYLMDEITAIAESLPEHTVIKVHFRPDDTAREVYDKFNAAVLGAKDEMENSGVDTAAGLLTATPRMALKFVMWLVRRGLLPKFLLAHPEMLDMPPETVEKDIL